MRIISGIYKGRTLVMPQGIKPTQNRVRKALFDILGELSGLTFLELFSGSGAVGFEALSYGAKELVLVENNRDCLEAINNNIEALGIKNCEIFPHNAEIAIRMLREKGRKFDIVFLDPPYHEDLPKKTLQTLGAYDILAANGFLVIQHFKRDALPKESGDLVLIKESKYGSTLLSFYKKKEDA